MCTCKAGFIGQGVFEAFDESLMFKYIYVHIYICMYDKYT